MQILHNLAASNPLAAFFARAGLRCGSNDGPLSAHRSPGGRLRVDTIIAASVR